MDHTNPKMIVRNKISTSYGLIVYTIHKAQVWFLLTRRRDTFSYECILRGLYTPELLREYVINTTTDERDRLLRHDFDLLWKDLWVSPKRRLYRAELKRAKEVYEQNIEEIRKLIQEAPSVGNDIWEFPKGRMFVEENAYQCALREFEEETNVSSHLVTLMKDAGSFEDNYQGTDHKMYRSVYFLGNIPNGKALEFKYLECPHHIREPYISDEVMDIRWMTYQDATDTIIPSRKKVLDQVNDFLNKTFQE